MSESMAQPEKGKEPTGKSVEPDSSVEVYSFWKSLLRNPERFCRKIKNASLTVDEWRRQRDVLRLGGKADTDDLGFSLFYLNRCNRSGIPNGGVIGGLDQSGKWKIDARFPVNELIRRIEVIAEVKKKITISNLDAEDYIKLSVPKLPRKSLIYFDPPYFRKANRLYLDHYHPDDHERIAMLIQGKVKRPWVVSYDKEP